MKDRLFDMFAMLLCLAVAIALCLMILSLSGEKPTGIQTDKIPAYTILTPAP